jgi:hypothetical protein
VIASGPPPPANPMMAPNSRHHPPAPVNYQPFTAIFPSQQQVIILGQMIINEFLLFSPVAE